MKWLDGLPEEPGDYVYQDPSSGSLLLVEIFMTSDCNQVYAKFYRNRETVLLAEIKEGCWFGPIPDPPEPEVLPRRFRWRDIRCGTTGYGFYEVLPTGLEVYVVNFTEEVVRYVSASFMSEAYLGITEWLDPE